MNPTGTNPRTRKGPGVFCFIASGAILPAMSYADRFKATQEVVTGVEEFFRETAPEESPRRTIGRVLGRYMLMGEAWAWREFFRHGCIAMPTVSIEAEGVLSGASGQDTLRLRMTSGGYTLPAADSDSDSGANSDMEASDND